MPYLILNTKSVDYHDGVHFVKCYYACENSETLRKNVKEIMLLYFLSLKQRRPLMVWIIYGLS